MFALQAHVETVEGSRVVVDRHRYSGKPLDEAVAELSRTRAEAAEFHCMLVRTRIFDELGPLDEQLITAREHLDVCMRARDAGYEVWYEPAAVAVYEFPIPLPSRDRAVFVYRWSRTLTARTLDHFAETWRLDPARLAASAGAFAEQRRRLAYNLSPRLLNRAFHKMGPHVVGAVDRVADAIVVAYYTRRRSRSRGTWVAHAASWLDASTTGAAWVSRPDRRDATARSG